MSLTQLLTELADALAPLADEIPGLNIYPGWADGPSPPALGLMQELKRQFDPHGTLNPGRFVAGI